MSKSCGKYFKFFLYVKVLIAWSRKCFKSKRKGKQPTTKKQGKKSPKVKNENNFFGIITLINSHSSQNTEYRYMY